MGPTPVHTSHKSGIRSKMFCKFDAAGLKSEFLRSIDLCLSGPNKKLSPNRHLFHKGSANMRRAC